MKQLLSFSLLLIFAMLAFSCQKEDRIEPEPRKEINIQVSPYFKTSPNREQRLDGSAKVYLYYGVEVPKTYPYTYEGEGVFIIKEKVYKPDLIVEGLNDFDKITVRLAYPEDWENEENSGFTIITESGYYPGKFFSEFYPGFYFRNRNEVIWTCIFYYP